MSLGDMLVGLIGGGNPFQTGAQNAYTGQPPQPGPQPGPQGGPQSAPGSPAAPPAAPGQPTPGQPQALQSQPDMAQAYLRLVQQSRASNMFDRGVAGLEASLAPPGQQAAWLGSAPPAQDPGEMLGNLMKVQQFNYEQQQRQIMAQAAPGLAKQLFGANPTSEQLQTAQGIIASGKYGDVETSLTGGSDLNQRQYLQQQRTAQAAGQTFPDFATWTAQHTAAAAAGTKTAEDYASEKSNATSTFPDLDRQYQKAEEDAEYLAANAGTAANPGPTVKAVKDWPSLTKGYSGQAAVKLGLVDQATADARAKLDELMNEQFTAGLRDTKNVRSLTEANKIGASMTAIDNPQASPTFIQGEANRIMTTAQAARANLTAAAGRQVPFKYNGVVDPGYLDKTSPLYNGAKMETPDTTVRSEADVGRLPSGRAFVVPDGSGRIGYAP